MSHRPRSDLPRELREPIEPEGTRRGHATWVRVVALVLAVSVAALYIASYFF